MSSEKKILPVLYPLDRNLKKTWFIKYTGQDGKPLKSYGQLNHLPTLKQRLKEAERIIDDLLARDAVKPKISAGNQLMKDLQSVFDLRKPSWKPKTFFAYQTHLSKFISWYISNDQPKMDTMQAMLFLNSITESGSNATTRNNYRANIKSLFNDLQIYYKNRYPDNPFAGTKKIREARKTKEWFRPGQMKEALAVIANDIDLLLAVKLMYHCFTRPNELRQLKVRDINFETGKLKIESIIAKVSTIRHIPIPADLLEELKEYFKNTPGHYYVFFELNNNGESCLSRDNLSKRHKIVMDPLCFGSGYTFYSWKNTGAVKMLLQDKRSIRYISKCMGHHSLDMTDKYFQSLGIDEMDDPIIFPMLPRLYDSSSHSKSIGF